MRSVLRVWSLRLGAAVAGLLLVLLSTTRLAAAESGSHVVEAYQAALDRRDLDGALALFDPDAEVTVGLPTLYDVPVRIAVGRQQLGAWLRGLVADGAHLGLQDRPQLQPQVVGERVIWLVVLEQASFGRPIFGSIRAFVRDGRIVRLAYIVRREDTDTLQTSWLAAGPAASEQTAGPPVQALALVAAGAGLVSAVATASRARRRARAPAAAPRRSELIAGLRRAYHLD